MYTLSYPWLLFLLPLPWVLRRVLPAYRESRQAVRAPRFQRTAELSGQTPTAGAVVLEPAPLERVVQGLAWCMLVVVLAGPQYLEEPIQRVVPSRDLLLLVDLSGSMETEDFTNADGETVDRLTAVKEVLHRFLERREGDRVGLIVFGNAAFVQVPFTQDLEACRILLDEMAVRMAGPRTAFGDAIGLGITLFERSELEDRVMISLTDGNDTGSKVPPPEAARIAQDKGITIHVVGVGDPTATGEEKLDTEVLEKVAATTQGRFFHAEDREGLAASYGELDKLSTRDVESQSYRPRRALFHWPLAAFLLMGLVFHGAGLLCRLRI